MLIWNFYFWITQSKCWRLRFVNVKNAHNLYSQCSHVFEWCKILSSLCEVVRLIYMWMQCEKINFTRFLLNFFGKMRIREPESRCAKYKIYRKMSITATTFVLLGATLSGCVKPTIQRIETRLGGQKKWFSRKRSEQKKIDTHFRDI